MRLVGGALAGSLEGTVTSLGLFYTTLTQGADRLLVPNSVLLSLVVVPLREPDKVDVRARFPADASPQRDRGTAAARDHRADPLPARASRSRKSTPTGVVLRVNATPLRPEDGSQLAEEVLEALRGERAGSRRQRAR